MKRLSAPLILVVLILAGLELEDGATRDEFQPFRPFILVQTGPQRVVVSRTVDLVAQELLHHFRIMASYRRHYTFHCELTDIDLIVLAVQGSVCRRQQRSSQLSIVCAEGNDQRRLVCRNHDGTVSLRLIALVLFPITLGYALERHRPEVRQKFGAFRQSQCSTFAHWLPPKRCTASLTRKRLTEQQSNTKV